MRTSNGCCRKRSVFSATQSHSTPARCLHLMLRHRGLGSGGAYWLLWMRNPDLRCRPGPSLQYERLSKGICAVSIRLH